MVHAERRVRPHLGRHRLGRAAHRVGRRRPLQRTGREPAPRTTARAGRPPSPRPSRSGSSRRDGPAWSSSRGSRRRGARPAEGPARRVPRSRSAATSWTGSGPNVKSSIVWNRPWNGSVAPDHRWRHSRIVSSRYAPRTWKRSRHRQVRELGRVPADADPGRDPPAAQRVERGQLLGEEHRVALRDDDHARAEADARDAGRRPRRGSGSPRRRGRTRPRVGVGHEDVVGRPDRRPAEIARRRSAAASMSLGRRAVGEVGEAQAEVHRSMVVAGRAPPRRRRDTRARPDARHCRPDVVRRLSRAIRGSAGQPPGVPRWPATVALLVVGLLLAIASTQLTSRSSLAPAGGHRAS